MKVRIEPNGPTAKIELDGEDFSRAIYSYELRHEAREYPELTLECRVFDYSSVDGQANVMLTDETRDLMLRLGWTPPEEDA